MPRYVIQQHHATSMHFDFRLEVAGTFRSWAVPKGPSMDPADKRLAMAVDDHSLSWGDFEGVIPNGQYGAGPVIVWDRGSYENLREESMEDALAAGHASFRLEGEKLRGGWSLRRIDGRRWLLVKRRDEEADGPDPVAVRADTPFSDSGWIFERKLDGIRCLAVRDGSGVSLMSRTARRMNDQFPELVRALEADPARDFIADGEIVAFEGSVTSFARLQQRARRRVPVFLYVFDLPRHDGEDLRPLPLRERKARLRRALEFSGPIRFNPHRKGEHGEELYHEACRKGREGVIAERADSPYHGGRARDWLKLKCHAEQELGIGGV